LNVRRRIFLQSKVVIVVVWQKKKKATGTGLWPPLAAYAVASGWSVFPKSKDPVFVILPTIQSKAPDQPPWFV